MRLVTYELSQIYNSHSRISILLLKVADQLDFLQVSDFQTILVTVQEASKRFHEHDLKSELVLRLNNLVKESEDSINKLLGTLRRCVRGDVLPNLLPGISRKTWLKEQTKVMKFGIELRKRREAISSLLTIISTYVINVLGDPKLTIPKQFSDLIYTHGSGAHLLFLTRA